MIRPLIRDFIYLDIERVRSFLAQVSGGLTSERTAGSEHQTGAEGQVKGRLPLLAEASGDVNYHYLRSQSETKSLHDHIFEELYSQLETSESLTDLSYINASHWIENFFKDGRFIKTRGLLKIVDYQSVKVNMEALPKVLETLAKLSSVAGSADNQAKGSNQSARQVLSKGAGSQIRNSTQTKQQKTSSEGQPSLTGGFNPEQIKDTQKQLNALPLKEAANLISQLYGDMIRVKIFPFFESNPERVLIGTADRTFFRYLPNTLTNLYGPVVDAGWVSILQINKGEPYTLGKLVSNSGNKIEDSLEQLADYLSSLGTLTQSVTFPAIAITPIAIYREI